MNVRCFCGNETYVIYEDDVQVLEDASWFDAESKTIRCPKCKNDALPVSLAEPPADGARPRVKVDPFGPVTTTRIKW